MDPGASGSPGLARSKTVRAKTESISASGFRWSIMAETKIIAHRFKKYVKKSGIAKPATPHSLRHSIAVHYLMGGAPLSFVQHFLGHESMTTTGIYTRLTDPMTKEIALHIPTAADVAEKKRKERAIKESRAEYGTDLEYWAEFVENVLEWQG